MRSRLLAVVPLTAIVLLLAVPVVAVLAGGLRAESLEVLTEPRTWRIVGFTLAQAVASTVASIAIALPAAYALYRCTVRGRRFLLAIITVPFVLPTVVVGLAFRILLPDSWNGTVGAIVIAHVFFNVGLVVRVVGGVWSRIDPRTADVAGTLGLSPLRVLLRVTWPLLRSSVLASAALVAMFTFTSFGVIMVLGSPAQPTVEVEIYRRTTQVLDLPAAAGLALMQLVVVLVALAWSARLQQLVSVRMRHASAWTRQQRTATDRICIVWTYVLVGAILLPLAALILASLRTGDSWSILWFEQVLHPAGGTTRDIPGIDIVATSLRYAVVATAIALMLGIIGALSISGSTRRGTALETILLLPLGVSAVTIGFGLLLESIRGPVDLRGWTWLVPVGQAMVAAPLVIMVILPVLRTIDPRLRHVAATLGASPARAWWTVDGRLVARSAVGAAGLACAVSLGEFGATAFLARVDAPTIPLQIVRLLGRPGEANLGSAAALAVILLLLTAVVLSATDIGRERW